MHQGAVLPKVQTETYSIRKEEMKDGDIIEWRGKNITHRARVTESENGELLATLENGRTFRLGDLLNCKSIKTIEQC